MSFWREQEIWWKYWLMRSPTMRAGFVCVFALLCVVAPTAVGFGVEGDGAGQFFQPRGIAVDQASGSLYVVDNGNQRVQKFGPEGQFELGFGWGVADGTTAAPQVCKTSCFAGIAGVGGGQFNSPMGVAVDNSGSSSAGDLYVVDARNLRVEKFSSSGEFLLAFGGEVNATTHSDICLAGEGCQAGVSGPGGGRFEVLGQQVVAVGPSGTVYVGDREKVQMFSPAGAFEGEIPLPTISDVERLAVDSAGDVYVMASGLLGVHKYEASGVEVGKPREPGVEPVESSIAVAPSDELFVYNEEPLGRVDEFDAAGARLASLPEHGLAVGLAYRAATRTLYFAHEHSVTTLTVPAPGPFILPGSEEVTEVLPTSALAHATVNPEGREATTVRFEYGTTTAYGLSTPASTPLDPVNEAQSVSVTATGGAFTLSYEGESSAEIPFNATAAEVQSALEAIPELGTGQVVVVGEAGGPWSVEFTGTLAGQNVAELSAGTASLTGPPEPTASVATTTPGVSLFDAREVSAAVTGLQPNTLYHYRATATNGVSQTTFGPDQSFTTAPSVSVEDESVSQVSSSSARLQAVLNPHGLPSEYTFEYGPTAAYGQSAPMPQGLLAATSSGVPVSVLIAGLSPGSTYHYRVIAHNSLGVSNGPDHSFLTQGAPETALADGRGWELVSPSNKHGSALEAMPEEGAVIQAGADGRAITYFAKAPVGDEAMGSRSVANSQLLSTRGSSGWSASDISTPHEEVAGLTVGENSEYKLFSSDLSLGLLAPAGATPLNPPLMGAHGEPTPYLRQADGVYLPLVTSANTPPGTKFGGDEARPGKFENGVEAVSMTPDASAVVLKSLSPQPLTEGFTTNGLDSIYEWMGGQLQPVSVLPNERSTGEEGLRAAFGHNQAQVRGAVSTDGSRIVFETLEEHLFVRDLARKETVQLDAGASPGAGVPNFQLASADGSRVFFTDAARLTADSTSREGPPPAGRPDLYMCEVAVLAEHLSCTLHDLTVDQNAGEAANVQEDVIGAGGDGRYVYFVANGALTAGAAHGDCENVSAAQASVTNLCNLYVRDTQNETTSLVAVLSNRDAGDWLGTPNHLNLTEMTSRVSPDGHYLAFMSSRSLTGYDNRDAHSGEADLEVYLYHLPASPAEEAGSLSCVSCHPSGARPTGFLEPTAYPGPLVDRPQVWRGQWLAGSLPGWTSVDKAHALYQSRYLSDSGRLFFESFGGLVPADANEREDVYEYEPASVGGCTQPSGCVALLSKGSSNEESAFLDASTTGDDVFFLTAAKLSETDTDTALDVYDAHVCTSALPCFSGQVSVSQPCASSDSCRAATPAVPDIFGAPISALAGGGGNLPPPPDVRKKPLTRAQKLAAALKQCKKLKSRRKRSACRASAQKRYGPTHAAKHNTAKAKNHGRRK